MSSHARKRAQTTAARCTPSTPHGRTPSQRCSFLLTNGQLGVGAAGGGGLGRRGSGSPIGHWGRRALHNDVDLVGNQVARARGGAIGGGTVCGAGGLALALLHGPWWAAAGWALLAHAMKLLGGMAQWQRLS